MDVKKIVKILAVGLSGALMTTWAYLMGTADATQKDIPYEDGNSAEEESSDEGEETEEELAADTN